MQPIHWLLAIIGIGGLCAAIAAARSKRPVIEQIAPLVESITDRLAPLTPDRGLDRVHGVTARELAGFVRRGSGEPGSVVVRLGAELAQAVAPTDNASVIAAVRGAALGLMPPLPNAATLPVEVRRDISLRPGSVTVTVGARRHAHGPTPAPVSSHGPVRDLGRDETTQAPVTIRLTALTAGLDDIELAAHGPLSVGRLGCDIALPEWTGESLFTSRKHAIVTPVPDDMCLEIRDQNSTHGVLVNDVPVSNTVMRHTDKLTLGRAEWIVTIKKVNS